jgi:single-strand DNA-binding protein
MALPQIQGLARLWADPELKYTPNGKAVITVPLVFNKRRKDAQGKWKDAGSVFLRGIAWQQFAEDIVEANLTKGDDVLVSGELVCREYESNGAKRQAWELSLASIGPNIRSRGGSSAPNEKGSADPEWSEPSIEKTPF